jgi:hypothetical protein
MFKVLAALALGLWLVPGVSRTADLNPGPLNLATLSCDKYENEVLPAAATSTTADSINTVMWLFGYSVAKSGAHVLYPDALSPFGFALDGECKANPRESLLDALAIVKPETKNPMNLTTLECSTFAGRHVESRAHRSRECQYHHDVAVRIFRRKIRQPSLRCGCARLLSNGSAGRLRQTSRISVCSMPCRRARQRLSRTPHDRRWASRRPAISGATRQRVPGVRSVLHALRDYRPSAEIRRAPRIAHLEGNAPSVP